MGLKMEQALSTGQKALQINLDLKKFGTFAEIGAGQEVARWFFHVGRAAGTIAKIDFGLRHGGQRFLIRQDGPLCEPGAAEAMLATEFAELQKRQAGRAPQHDALFVFADTVATRSVPTTGPGRDGWESASGPARRRTVGDHHSRRDARFRIRPGTGGAGNFGRQPHPHGAFYCNRDPKVVIHSLMDGLSKGRAEIDMIRFSGPAFSAVTTG